MMPLYWYMNTFLFCPCSHHPRGRVLFLRVLLNTQVPERFGLFQPPAFGFFVSKVTKESLACQGGVGSMVHPRQQERTSVPPGGLKAFLACFWW